MSGVVKPYTPASGWTFQVPDYTDKPLGPDAFRTFADSMPDMGPLRFVSIGSAYTLRAYELGKVLRADSPDPTTVTVDDSPLFPLGSQVAIYNPRWFSLRVAGVNGTVVQDERSLFVKGRMFGVLTKIAEKLWILATGIAGAPTPYNEISGGTVSEYTVGEKRFRVHTFTQSGTLTVLSAVAPFRMLLIGGGGGGAGGGPYYGGGGGGGAGGFLSDDALLLDTKDYPVVIGDGGAGGEGARAGAHNGVAGRQGGASTFNGLTAQGGGGGEAYQEGGTGGASGGGSYNWRDSGYPWVEGQGHRGGKGEMRSDGQGVHLAGPGGGGGGAGSEGGVSGGGAGKTSDISGSVETYASGGASAGGGSAAANTGNGGNGTNGGSPNYGGNGGSGVLKISYEVLA